MEQIIVAERLANLRKNAAISQTRVAEVLSVSRQAVSKWESGKASPSINVYAVLAGLYGVTPDMILSGSDYSGENTIDSLNGDTFAERLRAARATKGLSQGDLAEALSVSRQSVSKWERGEAEPDADRLLAISATLATPLAFLFPEVTPEMLAEKATATEGTEASEAENTEVEPIEDKPTVTEEIEEAVDKIYEQVMEENASEEPAVEEPVAEEPAVEEPMVEETVDDEPTVTEEAEEPAAPEETLSKKKDPEILKRYRKMMIRASRRRKQRAEAKRAAEAEKKEGAPAFRTISDVDENDAAYVFVDKNNSKVRTVLPLLAAVPVCATAIALLIKKRYKK